MNNNCNVQVRGYKYSTKKDRIWFFSLQHLDMLLHILKEPLKSFSGSLVFKALHDSYSYIRAKAVVKYHQGPRKAPNPFSSSTEKLQEKFHGQECLVHLGWSRDRSLCEGTAHGHSSSGHPLYLPGIVMGEGTTCIIHCTALPFENLQLNQLNLGCHQFSWNWLVWVCYKCVAVEGGIHQSQHSSGNASLLITPC